MDRGFRRGFTTGEKTELWDRWQRGESLKAIGRAFGKPSYGGIRPSPQQTRIRKRQKIASKEPLHILAFTARKETSYGERFLLAYVLGRFR